MAFLKAAAETPRHFKVLVAEAAPLYSGQQMVKELAQLKDNKGNVLIDTMLITDSAIFAMMSRVNKVIIGTHGILANGGLAGHSGAYTLTLAAKYHKVPVVVVSGIYKLAPRYAFDQDSLQEQGNPGMVLSYHDTLIDRVSVENPSFDYVPPEYVDLFVTDVGGHSPSYIYRLLKELYAIDDYDL